MSGAEGPSETASVMPVLKTDIVTIAGNSRFHLINKNIFIATLFLLREKTKKVWGM